MGVGTLTSAEVAEEDADADDEEEAVAAVCRPPAGFVVLIFILKKLCFED